MRYEREDAGALARRAQWVLASALLGAFFGLPLAADVRSTSGAMVEVAPPPASVDVGATESSTQVIVFQEKRDVALGAGLPIDIGLAGFYDLSALTPGTVPAGARVSVYLVHADQIGDTGSSSFTGTVVFDEPIVGLIVTDANLDASDAMLGATGTTYPSGLAFRGPDAVDGDTLRYSGRELEVDLTVNQYLDHIRVITGGRLTFSLDVGSDSEFSDPTPNGDEDFDPGDMYLGVSGSPAAPHWDDAAQAMITFPDAAVPAPYGACYAPGDPMLFYWQNLDLDGFDEVAIQLAGLLPGPILETQVEQQERRGILSAEHLLVSFDDDVALGWASCMAGRMPVESPSPIGVIHGTAAAQDEIVDVELALGMYPASSITISPWSDEIAVHGLLAPDPGVLDTRDDDVDALDWRMVDGAVQLFTVDHEGTAGLDTSVIFQAVPGFAPMPVVLRTHLGLGPSEDLDAFELVWLSLTPEVPGSPRALAIVFSTDDDDPQTPTIDESGGLDPTVLYASFLDGTYFLLAASLGDDVDAIAALPLDLILEEEVANPFCFGDGSGTACPCGNESAPGSGQGCANATGVGGSLAAQGSASISADDLVFEAFDLQPGQPAMLISGEQQMAGGDGVVFGDGLRCVGVGVKRLGVRVPDGSGHASWGPGLAASFGFVPGDERHFQVWYRSPGGPCASSFNLTNALTVSFVQ